MPQVAVPSPKLSPLCSHISTVLFPPVQKRIPYHLSSALSPCSFKKGGGGWPHSPRKKERVNAIHHIVLWWQKTTPPPPSFAPRKHRQTDRPTDKFFLFEIETGHTEANLAPESRAQQFCQRFTIVHFFLSPTAEILEKGNLTFQHLPKAKEEEKSKITEKNPTILNNHYLKCNITK